MTNDSGIPAALENRSSRALANLELGDVLLVLYVLVFVREYFWFISHNALGWILTSVISIVLWIIYVRTKPLPTVQSGKSFWLVVAVPLTVAYFVRAAFPDLSYDVLNYHLLNSERTLRGPLFQSGDFFHSTPFNPAADMITGITRLVLGYRLGTAINLLLLIWAAQIIDKILRRFIGNSWLRALSVLLVVLSENLLFEISTYLTDLFLLPLLFLATLLTLDLEHTENQRRTLVYIALLFGAAVALKFTSLAAVLPLSIICGYKLFLGHGKWKPTHVLRFLPVLFAAFVAPLLPFVIYIYRLTGNPLFPVANPFFKSPFWPIHGGWDARWGPHTFVETIFWPILIWVMPERHSELPFYSGRLSLGFVVALAGLIVAWRNSQARLVCFTLLASSLLWSQGAMGYSRYGLYQEVLAGLTIAVVGAILISRNPLSKSWWRFAVGLVFFVLLAAQGVLAVRYGLKTEWGDRTTIVKDPDVYFSEAKYFLRDHSLKSFMTADQLRPFENVKVWFETGQKSTGIEALLNPDAPILALRQHEFFATRTAWQKFNEKVKAVSNGPMYSLCFDVDLDKAKKDIAERGLELGSVTPVLVPFFSQRTTIGMMLLEIRVPQEATAREQFETAWLKSAFPSTDYREQIQIVTPITSMRAGEKIDLTFKVKNLGPGTLPAVGTKDFRYQVNLGNHWILNGVASEDNRAVLNGDLGPGAETEVRMAVKAPTIPGEYILEIDLVHEGVTWFKEQGATPLSIPVSVKP